MDGIGRAVLLAAVIACGGATAASARRNIHSAPPDLTQGGVPDDTRDWRLGPIGANGWVFNRTTRDGASREARQILITRVDPGGPADGKLELGDVILGVDGAGFDRDARKALAAAIDVAEARENAGRLRLQVWRDGEVGEQVLELPVLGRYSATSPYDCEKTDAIIDAAVAHLMDRPLTDDWLGNITALGLLATGREDVMPTLREFAHSMVVPGEVLNVETHEGMLSWRWSYKTIFLAEYYMRTGDDRVIPTLTEYATKIGMGQSGVGTWGHTMAARANTGHLHGHLGGYGALNQMGFTLMMALSLAERAGVTNDYIAAALARGGRFFQHFIGRGTIPYGDHKGGNDGFDNNGGSAAVAVMFDLLGNQEGAEFFSSMVLASTPAGREEGHTGHFWSHLWGGLGAARGGPAALTAFSREMRWCFDLERDWTGRFAFQDNAGEAGEHGTAKTRWDPTGARLLQLSLPRRQLVLTGRGLEPPAAPLDEAQIADLLAVGRLKGNPEARAALTREEILALLGHRLPPARHLAVRALLEQEIRAVEPLIEMLSSPNVHARRGAAEALGRAGYRSEAAVAALIETLRQSDDLLLRLYAVDALAGRDMDRGLAAVARPAIPVLLALAAAPPMEGDPRRWLQRYVCRALFVTGRADPFVGLIPHHGVEEADRALLVPAVRALLTHEDGYTRGNVAAVYSRLTAGELEQLWGDIYRATRDLPPSGMMFADGIRLAGLRLLQEHGIREGVDLAVSILGETRWGAGGRQQRALEVLRAYGGAARPALPALRNATVGQNHQERLEAAIRAIEEGDEQTLVSIAEH